MNLGAWWWSDRFVLRMHGAREVTALQAPRLHAAVRRLAARARIPVPRVYLIAEAAPNAFATGRSPRHAAIAVTEGLLRLLDEDELEGVLAHELAHVRNRDTLIATVAATIAGATAFIAYVARFGALFGLGRDDDEGPATAGGLGGRAASSSPRSSPC
jgi:heat shock protein HtpX